ncbi:MAG: HAD family hydrolase [Chloroflexi bacterium]|nr:HAD family hydrolase [Chloroflexota bacterium]
MSSVEAAHPIEAVILDVGGVLLIPHADVVSEALSGFGVRIDHALAERAHFVAIAALDTADSETGFLKYREAYAQAIGIPEKDTEAALERMQELWGGRTSDLWRQPVSGSVDGLRELARRNLKLGIVSNSDGTVEEQLRTREICQVGEGLGVPVLAIIDSHVVQVAKPAAEIFQHALEPIGVAPERALYVGDTVRYDVNGARAAGLWPIHFDPFELCQQRDDHAHVRRIGELDEILGSDG